MIDQADFERGRAAGEQILGSCEMLPDEHFDESDEFLKGFDEAAIECSTCGWWVEPHETNCFSECEECQEC